MISFVIVVILLLLVIISSRQVTQAFTDDELISLRDAVKENFLHAFVSYMDYGYPYDEVYPVSCKGRDYKHRVRGTLDDSLGNYLLTLVDSLDTLVSLREEKRFIAALEILRHELTFDTDIDVSVFETNIRVLGGLLSSHQLAKKLSHNKKYNFDYDGFLLEKAKDLGDRLLPAFMTKTSIPYHRINLMHGVRGNESSLTCPAAAGSYLMEFGLLSRLLKDSKYEIAAFKASKAIFDRRSKLDLIGPLIDVNTGQWIYSHTGIGAGFDSYYEYLMKGYSLLGDIRLLRMFDISYNAIEKHVRSNITNSYIEVDMTKGYKQPMNYLLSSLSAFWPSLQVLHGRVSSAKINFDRLMHFYKKFEATGLPDIFDTSSYSLLDHSRGNYNRPELIESSYYLFEATKDSKYLIFAKDFHNKLKTKRTKCGFSSFSDISTGTIDDRMDSFVLSETLKYLYLIFDEAIQSYSKRKSFFCDTNNNNNLNQNDNSSTLRDSCISKSHTLFTTEGHLFIIEHEALRKNGIHANNQLSLQTCLAI